MSAEKLVLGKPIQMCIVEAIDIEDVENIKHDYISKLVKCIDYKIFVEYPVKASQRMLHKGDILHVLGPYENEYGSFYTRVSDMIQGDVPLLVLDLISEIKRVQRRKMFRLRILKEIRFKVSTDVEYKAYLTDISGGGASISTEQDISEGTTISLQLDLDGKETEVDGNIVRKQYNKEKDIYTYGINFNDIDENKQEKIIQYIHKEQVKALKRGIRG